MEQWTPFNVPYDIHTGRELEFMLTGGKPLAHFSEAYPPDPDEEIIPRNAFRPHVLDGTFETCEFVTLLAEPLSNDTEMRGIIHVLYAQKEEAWRIAEYLAMTSEAEEKGWSERQERQQGTLLGYTDAENDAHIERALNSPHAKNFPWLRRLADGRRRS